MTCTRVTSTNNNNSYMYTTMYCKESSLLIDVFPFVAADLESELQRAMGMWGTIGAGAGDLDEYCVRVWCVWRETVTM